MSPWLRIQSRDMYLILMLTYQEETGLKLCPTPHHFLLAITGSQWLLCSPI